MARRLSNNLVEADGIYEQLIALHSGRSEAESMRLNARLILLLINQIGDTAAVRAAIAQSGRAGVVEETKS